VGCGNYFDGTCKICDIHPRSNTDSTAHERPQNRTDLGKTAFLKTGGADKTLSGHLFPILFARYDWNEIPSSGPRILPTNRSLEVSLATRVRMRARVSPGQSETGGKNPLMLR
jgi:hypothetical protein